MAIKTYTSSAIAYFHQDGRENLKDVLRLVQRARCKRQEISALKVVFLTAFGEGPVLAIRAFKTNRPNIIAVTFPPSVKLPDGSPYTLSEQVLAYLRAMKVEVVSSRLPFDGFDGSTPVDSQMAMIKTILSRFGRSTPLCVQAVLQACDAGLIAEGEDVISVTGDMAAIVTASTTANFLVPNSPFSIREFICKPSQPIPPSLEESRLALGQHRLAPDSNV